jgi:hypothetical protein
MDHAKCGHSEATCHGDICLRDVGAHLAPPPEIQIELDRAARIEHAKALFHMAMQRAESALDAAIAEADTIWATEMRQLRHRQHERVA